MRRFTSRLTWGAPARNDNEAEEPIEEGYEEVDINEAEDPNSDPFTYIPPGPVEATYQNLRVNGTNSAKALAQIAQDAYDAHLRAHVAASLETLHQGARLVALHAAAQAAGPLAVMSDMASRRTEGLLDVFERTAVGRAVAQRVDAYKVRRMMQIEGVRTRTSQVAIRYRLKDAVDADAESLGDSADQLHGRAIGAAQPAGLVEAGTGTQMASDGVDSPTNPTNSPDLGERRRRGLSTQAAKASSPFDGFEDVDLNASPVVARAMPQEDAVEQSDASSLLTLETTAPLRAPAPFKYENEDSAGTATASFEEISLGPDNANTTSAIPPAAEIKESIPARQSTGAETPPGSNVDIPTRPRVPTKPHHLRADRPGSAKLTNEDAEIPTVNALPDAIPDKHDDRSATPSMDGDAYDDDDEAAADAFLDMSLSDIEALSPDDDDDVLDIIDSYGEV